MKKRIRLPGFSARDTTPSHKLAIWGGFAASIAGCAIGGVGVMAVLGSSDWQTIGRVAQSATNETVTSAAKSSTGLPADMGVRMGQIQLASEFAQAAGYLPSLPGLNGVRTESEHFKAAWSDMIVSTAPIDKAVRFVPQVQQELVSKLPQINQIATRIEGARGNGPGSSAYESISRLQGYATSGFGAEAGARLVYDLENLAYQLRSADAVFGASGKETRQAIDSLYQAIYPFAVQLKDSQPRGQDVALFIEKLKAVDQRSSQLIKAAGDTQAAAFVYVVLGGLLVLGGAIVTMLGIVLAVSEFGSRFRSALSQFNQEEGAMVQLSADAAAIADGNFQHALDTENESTKDVAQALERIASNVRNTCTSASHDSSKSLNATLRAESLLVTQKNTIAAEGARLASIAETVGGSYSNLQWLSIDAKSVNQVATYSVDALHSSARAMSESVDRMDSIRSAVQETSKRVKRLGEGSQEVGFVLDEVETLSEQANVLAMNSALEAERAGDAGGGFKLISAEIKLLASRLGSSVERAKGAVDLMQADVRLASESMEKSAQKVAAGTFVGEISTAALAAARFNLDTISAACGLLESSAGNESAALDSVKSQIELSQDQIANSSRIFDSVTTDLTAVIQASRHAIDVLTIQHRT